MKFSIKAFFSKYDQIRSFLRIWSHLLKKSLMKNLIFHLVKKSLMENFIFCAQLLKAQPLVYPKLRILCYF